MIALAKLKQSRGKVTRGPLLMMARPGHQAETVLYVPIALDKKEDGRKKAQDSGTCRVAVPIGWGLDEPSMPARVPNTGP